MIKQVQYKIKGMNQDSSESAFTNEFSYKNMNIRIMPTDENTLLSIINEKGTKEGLTLEGTILGTATLGDYLIVFTHGIKDSIYRIKLNTENKTLISERIVYDNLGFQLKYPIETLVFYENEDIQKVYWTDGLNSPRVINIAAKQEVIDTWNNKSFDFIANLKLEEEVTVKRNLLANGIFSPGTIQYAFTYFNKYGQESNIFYTTSLQYISYNNRGASPEDKVGNSFYIKIEKYDKSFDYIRVYSIQRTSINGTPLIKKVTDIPIIKDSSEPIIYIDNGTSGEFIDSTELLYVGGEKIICNTLEQKDNTLFFGNIKLQRNKIDKSIKDYFRTVKVSFKFKTAEFNKLIPSPNPTGYYPYINQLQYGANVIKTFKYLEWYRFGVQFQHFSGKWSEPIFIGDFRNTSKVDATYGKQQDTVLSYANTLLNNKDIINQMINSGYIKVRPVIVYPKLQDRECICQGILCPTVYNVKDRYSNSPFVQSSWFIRPNLPFDIEKSKNYSETEQGWQPDYSDRDNPLNFLSENSRQAIVLNNNVEVKLDNNPSKILEIVNKGAWAEFRHNYPIPSSDKRNSEIQCIYNPPEYPEVDRSSTDAETSNWVYDNAENFYIDQSIITMHSPEIEFDSNIKSIDTSNLKLRIIGIVPLTSFASDIKIITSTPPNKYKNSNNIAPGFYKENVGVENISRYGYKGLMSGCFWIDELSEYKSHTENTQDLSTGFVVYPFHRNGSLNNTKYAKDNYKSALLDKKYLVNNKYSYNTYYFNENEIWDAYKKDDNNYTGISGISIFDSNEVTLTKIPAPKNSHLSDLNYYGNIDKILTVYPRGNKKEGYPIITTGTQDASKYSHVLFTSNYMKLENKYTEHITSFDPIRMKYKSTSHAVIALNYTVDGKVKVLPTLYDGNNSQQNWAINTVNKYVTNKLFWEKEHYTESIKQDLLNIYISPSVKNNIYGEGPEYGWLWLGELYNDNVVNRFGGDSEEAVTNNLWVPAGKPISLLENNNPKDSIILVWSEGDTYYQRYDHIKTYPFTKEDQNSILETVSFMCETRINLDGRYDRNRGQIHNFALSPTNFNLMNEVYSQQDNFFNYRALNENRINLDNFTNTISWTKTKIAGSLIDSWTNITLANTLDLDGDKGELRALRRLNNNIIAFQDKGISHILYNENVQIQSTEGVPIEIANSGKVQGKRYISTSVGCSNKWSICETPRGLYFIDDITKGIYLFNGQLENISDKYGFHSWINKMSDGIKIWNPETKEGFVTQYDKLNSDVFFINKDECLCFSEGLNIFTSFYNYEGTSFLNTIKDQSIWSKDNSLWLHNAGDYNYYFGEYKPFYINYIVTPNNVSDKIFNNIEFRSDTYSKEGKIKHFDTFDKLEVWNEYQRGSVDLINKIDTPSSLKKKFRVWRANIPRDNSNHRDRIRNPWVYIKLSKNKPNTDKTILHDMIVSYFE